ncbi:MAG: hypothetical protein HXY22_08280 [Alphaproteobacteria bacterium]|nr:hypothetical protein [Alphaproteobacteria bacterium]
MLTLKEGALAAAIALVPVMALADDTAMQGAFGNTVKIATASGEVTLFFEPDGTYSSSSGAGGLWRISGEKVCLQPTGGAEECEINAKAAGAGDSWQQPYKGGQATVTIVGGR